MGYINNRPESGGDPWENLANAVIITAVNDYRNALKKYYRYRNTKGSGAIETRTKCLDTMNDVKQFINSDLFTHLTRVDSELIEKELEKESKIIKEAV